MRRSKIEWTDATWNPLRGCRRISPGCENCYAERLAARMSKPGQWGHGLARMTKSGPRWTGKIELVPAKLSEPLKWREPRMVFVNSTSDLFHEDVPFQFIAAVYGVMAHAPRHTFQILTKRPERRNEFHRWITTLIGPGGITAPTDAIMGCEINASKYGVKFPAYRWKPDDHIHYKWPLPNVWEGVSIENQETALARSLVMLETQAAVRFASYEPALGRVHWAAELDPDEKVLGGLYLEVHHAFEWVIVGGESGLNARPCEVGWIEDTIRQLHREGKPVFVKQAGAKPIGFGFDGRTLRDAKGGDPLEWPEHIRVREMPQWRGSS